MRVSLSGMHSNPNHHSLSLNHHSLNPMFVLVRDRVLQEVLRVVRSDQPRLLVCNNLFNIRPCRSLIPILPRR